MVEFFKIKSNLEDGKENHGVNQVGKIKLDSLNLNMLAHAKADLGDLGKKKRTWYDLVTKNL